MAFNFKKDFEKIQATLAADKTLLTTARTELVDFLNEMGEAGVAVRVSVPDTEKYRLNNGGHHTYHDANQEAWGTHVNVEFFKDSADLLGNPLNLPMERPERESYRPTMSPALKLCFELRHRIETNMNPNTRQTHPVMLHPYAMEKNWIGHSPEARTLSFAGLNSDSIPHNSGAYGTPYALKDGKLDQCESPSGDFKTGFGLFVNDCIAKGLIGTVPETAQKAEMEAVLV